MRICVDLDDTIMDYCTGEPILGAIKALQKMKQEGHQVIIFTANWLTHKGIVMGWLKAHKIPYDDLVMSKPIFDILIDDRARQFTGWDKDYVKS